MSQLYPERTIIAFLSVAPACHPSKLCLLKKIICAGKEPGSKCEVEGMVWREGERLQGELWLGHGSAQSLLQTRSAKCKMLLWTLLVQDPGGRRLWGLGPRAAYRGWILGSVSVTLVPVMVFPCFTQVSLSKPLFFMQVV